MNRSFSRKIETVAPPTTGRLLRGGVGGLPAYDTGKVAISKSTLYTGGVASAFGGMMFGVALLSLAKQSALTAAVGSLGVAALVPGVALIGFGYYTLWTSGDDLAV